MIQLRHRSFSAKSSGPAATFPRRRRSSARAAAAFCAAAVIGGSRPSAGVTMRDVRRSARRPFAGSHQSGPAVMNALLFCRSMVRRSYAAASASLSTV